MKIVGILYLLSNIVRLVATPLTDHASIVDRALTLEGFFSQPRSHVASDVAGRPVKLMSG